MRSFGFLSLAFFAFQALLVNGEEAAEAAENAEQSSEVRKLDVTVTSTFPGSEVFGVKLVNGQQTQSMVQFTNNEEDKITVTLIGGSLWTLDEPGHPGKNLRNLTAIPYRLEIEPNSQFTLPYSFATEMHPQDLRLNLAAIVSDKQGAMFPMSAFNGTVSIVEPDTSIFDPQVLFLYFFLLGCSAGAVYFFYTLWIAPYFPQKRKADQSKKPATRTSDSTEQVKSEGDPSGKTFDAEWIPAHHIQRPEARKVKSGSGRKVRA